MNQSYKFGRPIAEHFHSFPGSGRLCRQKPDSATTVKVEPRVSKNFNHLVSSSSSCLGTSLLVWWLRVHFAMQGTQV